MEYLVPPPLSSPPHYRYSPIVNVLIHLDQKARLFYKKKKAPSHEMYASTGKYTLKESFSRKALFSLSLYCARVSRMYSMTVEVCINRVKRFTSKNYIRCLLRQHQHRGMDIAVSDVWHS